MEHQANFLPYAAHKQNVVDEREVTGEEAELWLFHEADAIEDVAEKSFGVHFARGPRMARWFIHSKRG